VNRGTPECRASDGFGRAAGDVKWLDQPRPAGNYYGMRAFLRLIDTILGGRKTYDVSLALGKAFRLRAVLKLPALRRGLAVVR
jgi:hypothetical protein